MSRPSFRPASPSDLPPLATDPSPSLRQSMHSTSRLASSSRLVLPPTHRFLYSHPAFIRTASSSTSTSSPSPSSDPTSKSSSSSSTSSSTKSASSHLFALAEEEEASLDALSKGLSNRSSRTSKLLSAASDDAPWTGDEPIEHTVLRMLTDKHKPSRTGKIISAEEKLKASKQNRVREVEIAPYDTQAFQREVLERAELSGRGGRGGSRVEGGGGTDEDGLLAPTITTAGVVKNTKVWDGHLVGGDPNHMPWHSEYVTPHSLTTPLIRRGHLLKSSKDDPSSTTTLASILPNDPSGRAALRRATKLNQGPLRLGRAREGVLDYELTKAGLGKDRKLSSEERREESEEGRRLGGSGQGIGKEGEGGTGGKLEVRMGAGDESLGAGWGSLVELRIERARAQGSFKNLPGTGRPLSNDPLQANPYISRSEFFMNRIVKNNEALPAWIQYQKEHTNGLDHLRLKLSEAVERRLRLLPGGGVIEGIDESEGARLRGLGLSREFEVGGKDRSFWEGMVEEVNKLQRRGDGIAPASARRGPTTIDSELTIAFRTAYRRLLTAPLASSSDGSTDPYHHAELSYSEMYRIPWGALIPDWVRELRLWFRKALGIREATPPVKEGESGQVKDG